MIAIQSINFKIKEWNSLLDKRYHLDMIETVWKAWRDCAESNYDELVKSRHTGENRCPVF